MDNFKMPHHTFVSTQHIQFKGKQQLKESMIDYYETKSQPISRLQVWEAY